MVLIQRANVNAHTFSYALASRTLGLGCALAKLLGTQFDVTH
jgi:hypothetical protein